MTTLEQPNYYYNDVYLEIHNAMDELDNMYCNELVKYNENIDICNDESYIDYYKQKHSFTEASKDISISPIFPDLPLLSSDFPEIVFDKSSFIPIKIRRLSKNVLENTEDIIKPKKYKVCKKIGKKIYKKICKKIGKKIGKKIDKKIGKKSNTIPI